MNEKKQTDFESVVATAKTLKGWMEERYILLKSHVFCSETVVKFDGQKLVSLGLVQRLREQQEAKEVALRKEFVQELINGWDKRDREEWDIFLIEEIAPYYPTLFEFLKDVKLREVLGK
jgi:hypothetical protein